MMETSISKAGSEYGLDIYDEDGKYVGWLNSEELEQSLIEIRRLNAKPFFDFLKKYEKEAKCKVIQQNNSRVRSSKNYDGLRTIGYCQACKKAIKTFNKQAVEGTDFRFKNEKICCMRCK